jgi:hypothetical protein
MMSLLDLKNITSCSLAFGLQLMLNLSKMIKCMQCPSSACLLSLCVYYDQHGLAFYFVAGKIGDICDRRFVR